MSFQTDTTFEPTNDLQESWEVAARLFPNDPAPSILPSAEGSITFEAGSDPYPEPIWDDVIARLDECAAALYREAELATRLG